MPPGLALRANSGALRSATLRDAERLAALHGAATVQVEARRMEGTTVYLRLPVSEGRRPRNEPANPVSAWPPTFLAQGDDTAPH